MRAGHNQYAPMPGVLALREAIAAKVEQLYGASVDPVTEVVGHLRRDRRPLRDADRVRAPGRRSRAVRAVLRLVRAGDPVERRHAGVRQPALSRTTAVDWDEVRRAITPRTRLILVNTPHNPTGIDVDRRRHAPARRDRRRHRHRADRRTRSTSTSSSTAGGTRACCAIRSCARARCVISSFGKTFHTTGWKVGYCVAPQPLIAEVTRVHQFITFTVHTPSQIAFAEFVQRDPRRPTLPAFYQGKRDLFLRLIDGLALPSARRATAPTFSCSTTRRSRERRRSRHGRVARQRARRRRRFPCRRSCYKDTGGPGAALLLCEEGRDARRRGRAAAGECRRRIRDSLIPCLADLWSLQNPPQVGFGPRLWFHCFGYPSDTSSNRTPSIVLRRCAGAGVRRPPPRC